MSELPERPPVLQALPMLAVLVDHGVDFVIIGGFSLAAHGFVRGTKDVDIVPAFQPENLERLMGALEDLDASLRGLDDFRPEEIPVALGVDGLAQGGNWCLRTRLGWLDILQVVPGVEGYDQLRAAAVERELPGISSPVFFAGRDDLLAMKRAAGRPQDLVDVERLLTESRSSET